jgi:hypothetical protein
MFSFRDRLVAGSGVLVADAGIGGYQVGSGISQVANGNYLAGGAQIVGGGLAIAGSVAGAGALHTPVNSIPANVSSGIANGQITGYTRHGLNQAISRDGGQGVSASAILDAVRNPQSATLQANGTTKFIGESATVVINPQGKIVTVWGQPRAP